MKVKMYLCGGEKPTTEFALGVAYLKSNCETDEHQIEIVQTPRELVDCDMIGLSTNGWGIKEAVDILHSTDIPVIIGGQATLWSPIKEESFQHVVNGEGERALTKILNGEAKTQVIQEPLMTVPEMN